MFETNIIYIIQDMNFLFNKLPYSLIDIDSLSFEKSSRIDLWIIPRKIYKRPSKKFEVGGERITRIIHREVHTSNNDFECPGNMEII